MDERWKNLVLQWVNCFFHEESMKSIADLKHQNLLSKLSLESSSSYETENMFLSMLQFLRDQYPKYGLPDSENECWQDENELYMLAMLLLLHASIFQPCELLRQRANETLPPRTQTTIVHFLEKAMQYGVEVQRQDLLNSIPQVLNIVSNNPETSPLTSKRTPKLARGTTPLAEFLSSPVARNGQRLSDRRLRERIAQLETDLESEIFEKDELKKKIIDLERCLEKKCAETKTLKDNLATHEENAELFSPPAAEPTERVKLREEVRDLKQYIFRLEGDIEDLNNSKASLQQQITSLQKMVVEWESRASSSESECLIWKEKVKQQISENETLGARCLELELMKCTTPTHSPMINRSSKLTIKSPDGVPESLGPIIEAQLIQKEKENEELQAEIFEAEKKQRALQTALEELDHKLFREQESALRAKIKYDTQLKDFSDKNNQLTKELTENLEEKERLLTSLKDFKGKYDVVTQLLKECTTARDAAVHDAHSLSGEKHDLEVKIALLNAKLQIAEESRVDIDNIAASRAAEVAALKQEKEDLLVQVRVAVKDKDKLELSLNEVTKKRDALQRAAYNLEVEKESMDEKVLALSEQFKTKEQQYEILNKLNKELQEQIVAVSQEKETVHLQLENIASERDNLSSTCSMLTNKYNNACAEIVSLTEEKVHMDALLKDITHQRDEAFSTVSQVHEEKNEIQGQLNKLLTENERITCQIHISNQHESDLNMEIKELQKQKKLLERELTVAIQNLEDVKNTHESHLSECLLEKDELTAKFSAESNKMRNEIQNLQHTLSISTAEKEDLLTELSSTKEANINLEQQITSISQEFSSSQSKVQYLNSELHAAQLKCDEKDSLINDLLVEKSDRENDISDHISQRAIALEESTSLKKQVKILCDEKSNLEQKINSLNLECSDVHEKMQYEIEEKNNLMIQLDSLNEKINEMQKIESDLKSQLENVTQEKKTHVIQCQMVQEELTEKSNQLSTLQRQHSQLTLDFGNLKKEIELREGDIKTLLNSKDSLENELNSLTRKLEVAVKENDSVSSLLTKASNEKDKALLKIKSLEKENQLLILQLETEKNEEDKILKKKEIELSQLNAAYIDKENNLIRIQELFSELEEKNKELQSILDCVSKEKNDLELKITEINLQFQVISRNVDELRGQLLDKDQELILTREQLNSLKEQQVITSQQHELLCAKLELSDKEKISAVDELNKLQDEVQELQLNIALRNVQLDLLLREKENLNRPINETSKSTFQGTTLNSTSQQTEETVLEKDNITPSLKQELRILKDHFGNNGASMKNTEEETPKQNCCSDDSVVLLQKIKALEEQVKDEKNKLFTLEAETKNQKSEMDRKVADLIQQLAAARSNDKLAQLEQDEYLWQLDRAKSHLQGRLDGMMSQKHDLEGHLSHLRKVLEDVGAVCDNLFAALPANCDAVHEVANMKREVEVKLRAVDKKYADSLCGIIKTTYDILKWMEKQNLVALNEGNSEDIASFFSEKDAIEDNVSSLCNVMSSLLLDVRAVVNSCKFLSERCESYLKAQTRESLQIKTVNKESHGLKFENKEESLNQSSFIPSQHCRGNWFGGAGTVDEAYSLLKDSHSCMEKQLLDLQAQLKNQQPGQEDNKQMIAELQAKISALMLRPSQEQIDQKVKELHTTYAEKLEGMKMKMKQVVNEEVLKVELEKQKSEKEIIARYDKRISEFEQHIQGLSSQLWELGEKLLQEQQDHQNTQVQLNALRERQQHFISLSNQRTKSLECVDGVLHRNLPSILATKARKNTSDRVLPTVDSRSRAQSLSALPRDLSNCDEVTSRNTTKMAPASMGLAFPEEDEDGEVFNNDYLTELKEGRCQIPMDNKRLSELHYRNSLCPPHLKSSYPLETQFHDPKVYKDEELKGPDDKPRRPGKDRGMTSYKKPGPPTPSRKAGRLSLQSKDDLTPRGVLREHNESQTSHGSGILRAAKTTPKRLKALFVSSKVANASNLPASKKDENNTPGTPSSKRLSIFRRFGSSKESHSVTSGYSSFR